MESFFILCGVALGAAIAIHTLQKKGEITPEKKDVSTKANNDTDSLLERL